MDWQPIETAPLDGMPVLLWDPYWLMRVGRWEASGVAAAFGRTVAEPGHWITDLPYGVERGEKEMPLEPTHWVRLPEPPAPLPDSSKEG